MKIPAAVLGVTLLVAAPVRAQIHADVSTTMGTFTIDLDYVNSPLAVGNFIGLATGSKTWVDSTTSAARTGVPYYDGIIFHRVIAAFMNQTGSQRGDGSDGPGYTFPDEFATSDFTNPYVAAMANSGPQSNGSQLFFTVSPRTYLNNVHTVIGTIPVDDGPGGIVDGSRGVIDAINAVPVNGSKPITDVVINSITIRRIGAAALAFDELAQDLPVVSVPEVTLSAPAPGSDPLLLFDQPAGTSFHCSFTGNLTGWSSVIRYLDYGLGSTTTEFDIAVFHPGATRVFYQSAMVTWPTDAVFPDPLDNRTLAVVAPHYHPTEPYLFSFDAAGTAGTWSHNPGGTPETGTFQVLRFSPDGYGCTLILLLDNIDLPYWRLNRAGLESAGTTATVVAGRHNLKLALSELHYRFGLRTDSPGEFALTR